MVCVFNVDVDRLQHKSEGFFTKLEGFFRESEGFFRESEGFFRRCRKLLPKSTGFVRTKKLCNIAYRSSFRPSVAVFRSQSGAVLVAY